VAFLSTVKQLLFCPQPTFGADNHRM
jgi:hypothetical protein